MDSMKPKISVSFDVAAGGMERLRNQDEILLLIPLSGSETARQIINEAAFELDRDDTAYAAIEAARPDASNETINNLCDQIDSQIIAALTDYLSTVTKGSLDKVNPFNVESVDDDGEGCSLFIYVASPLFRAAAQ